jgi:hypothetical protein
MVLQTTASAARPTGRNITCVTANQEINRSKREQPQHQAQAISIRQNFFQRHGSQRAAGSQLNVTVKERAEANASARRVIFPAS